MSEKDRSKCKDLNKPVNLKLSNDIKKKFKEITHLNNTSMQDILFNFVIAYINNPERFKIKMEIINNLEVQ